MSAGCDKILEMLKAAEALPFLFVGSGMSRRYIGAENWESLLRIFASKANNSMFFYEKLRERAKNELAASGKNPDSVSFLYPKIADYIEDEFNANWYESPEYQNHREEFAEYIRDGLSPFKLELSLYCKGLMQEQVRCENEIVRLKELSTKSIAGIITTNYDCFMESLFPDFVPYVGQEELIFSNHLTVGEIYKIHGCCKKPRSIIINSNDYQLFNDKNAYLAAKLLTIFVEHPIIFLGYSISDDNILNILKSIVNCLSPEQIGLLQHRLIFVDWDISKLNLEVSDYSINFGPNRIIQMTKVSLKDYCDLYNVLFNIKAKYPTKLLRQIKNDIYKLTLTTDPNSKLVALNLNQESQDGEFEYVFGIGALEIGRTGFKMVTAERLYRDIVFDDDPGLINRFIVEDSLPLLMSRCGSINIPVYKYISNYDFPLPGRYTIFETRSFDDFSTRTLRTMRKNRIYHSISEIEKCPNMSALTKLNNIAALPREEINIEDLSAFLVHAFNTDPNILCNDSLKSAFKKLIRIYDFLKYKK